MLPRCPTGQIRLARLKRLRIPLAIAAFALTIRLIPYAIPLSASDSLPDDRALTFRDRNGLVLGTVLTASRDRTAVVPLAEVSPHFIDAILAAEDADFYQHGPVDLLALGRASYQAIRHRRIVSGASTITMQLARMMRPAPRTLPNKLREIWQSWRLAAGSSRDNILHAYVNQLPMGGNVYGIEAAARLYFNTSARDLTLAQATLLAAIPNDPNGLHPYYHWDDLLRRQTYVVDRMVSEGFITQYTADRVFTETLTLADRQQGIVAAPHFVFWQAQLIPDRSNSSTTDPAAIDLQTTLDLPLQTFVRAQVQQVVRALADRNVHQAAAIVIDNHTGDILAYVGSPDYFASQDSAQFDGVRALRQPGSALKPFLYQIALETAIIRPTSILPDIPTYYALPDARVYRPTDFDRRFQGPVRVRLALANSLNIPAVRVLERVTPQRFLDRLQELGFADLERSPEHYGLGLALGAGEVSLLQLARAYVTMARQGDAIELRSLLANETEGAIETGAIGDASTWALVGEMLGDRQARAVAFGVDSALNLPFPAAVKTGTSSNFRDTWAVGYTRDYTVATWVGNFAGSPMREVSGVDGAAPLWHRVMLHLHEDNEPGNLPLPDGMVMQPICALSGLRPTDVCETVVQEYVAIADLDRYERQLDTVYRHVDGEVHIHLPPEYDEWLALQGSALIADGQLQLLAPRDGDRFVLYPPSTIAPAGSQQVEFRISHFREDVEWRLNGELLSESDSDRQFWTLQPGVWTVEVSGGGMSDRATFTVELASSERLEAGFSAVE